MWGVLAGQRVCLSQGTAWPEVSEYKWGNRAFTHGGAGARASPPDQGKRGSHAGGCAQREESEPQLDGERPSLGAGVQA